MNTFLSDAHYSWTASHPSTYQAQQTLAASVRLVQGGISQSYAAFLHFTKLFSCTNSSLFHSLGAPYIIPTWLWASGGPIYLWSSPEQLSLPHWLRMEIGRESQIDDPYHTALSIHRYNQVRSPGGLYQWCPWNMNDQAWVRLPSSYVILCKLA